MSIQHVINWIEGPPDEIVAGMAIVNDAGIMLIGSKDAAGESVEDMEFNYGKITRHAQLIKPYELEWALSMTTKRELCA
jgi:hypothetical protein